ncbi:MAG: signal recognition particle-docking protein FtsY, partial [Pelagerythrobacter marensis]
MGTGLDDLIGQGTDEAAAAPRPAPAPAPTHQPAPAPQPPAPAPQPPTPAPQPAPQAPPAPRPAAPHPAPQPGLMGRLFGGGAPAEPRRELDDAMLEDLEDMLIAADMGTETALRVTANIAEGRMGRKISATELKQALAGEVTRIMTPVARPLPLYAKKPQVVLVVGVNGSGKTTTIGKLASQFKSAGKSVVIAAGDTFRAAAVEQLQVWGQRAGVPVMVAAQGSDPASLAYDAMA